MGRGGMLLVVALVIVCLFDVYTSKITQSRQNEQKQIEIACDEIEKTGIELNISTSIELIEFGYLKDTPDSFFSIKAIIDENEYRELLMQLDASTRYYSILDSDSKDIRTTINYFIGEYGIDSSSIAYIYRAFTAGKVVFTQETYFVFTQEMGDFILRIIRT